MVLLLFFFLEKKRYYIFFYSGIIYHHVYSNFFFRSGYITAEYICFLLLCFVLLCLVMVGNVYVLCWVGLELCCWSLENFLYRFDSTLCYFVVVVAVFCYFFFFLLLIFIFIIKDCCFNKLLEKYSRKISTHEKNKNNNAYSRVILENSLLSFFF